MSKSEDPTDQEVADAFDALDEADQDALVALAKTLGHDDPGQRAREVATSRRGFLGTVAGAAAAGTMAFSAGKAQAGSSQVGTIGTTSKPVDVVAEDVTSQSLAVHGGEMQSALDGLVVPVYDDGGVENAIDPTSTATPMQDAVDEIAANATGGAGTVLLPPGVVQEDTTIDHETGVSFQGVGMPKRGATAGGSVIEIQTGGADGISLGANSTGKARFDGFVLRGQGDNSTGADGITCTGASNVHIGQVMVQDFYGQAWNQTSGTLFQAQVDHLMAYDLDAGDARGVFGFGSALALNVRALTAYPTATTSGANSNILPLGNAKACFETLNLGGSAGKVLGSGTDTNQSIRLGYVNYEPSDQRSEPSELVDIEGHNTRVDTVIINGASGTGVSVQDVYWVLNSPANYRIGTVNVTNGASISRDIVRVLNDTAAPGIHEGESTDINNASGVSPLSNPINCLGDLTQYTG
jgi:hypothetical protein